MHRPLRFFQVALLLSLIYFFYFLHGHIVFERLLNSLFITFDDFPSEYRTALIDSVNRNNTPPLDFDYSSFATVDTAANIPKVIHFIWYRDLYPVRPDGSKIPSVGSDTPRLCRKYNPDFTINIWNETSARDVMEEHFEWFLPTYDGYRHPIQRVDAFKYFILRHQGGVYMDMDISCRRSLIPLLQFPAWFPRASPLGVNNDLMASRANHPIIEAMTESLKSRDRNLLFPYLTIFWTTGPRFTTDVLKFWFKEHSDEPYVKGTSKTLSSPDKFYVLPQSFYSEHYTFFGHRPGGSWYGDDVDVVLWLLARPWIVLSCATAMVLTCLAVVLRKRMPRRDLVRKAINVRWMQMHRAWRTS